ncbi:MAG: ATP-binding protein [Myxococcales bacterium]
MDGIYLRSNQSPEDTRQIASSALKTNRGRIARFIVKAAYVNLQGIARNVLTTVIGQSVDEQTVLRGRLEYQNGLVLEESEMDVDVLEAAIARGLTSFPVAGFEPKPDPTFTTLRCPSENGLSRWPGVAIWCEGRAAHDIPNVHEHVTGRGEMHDYFPNIYVAAKSWCRFPSYGGANDSRTGGFVLFIPDLRGQIGAIQWGRRSAEIETIISAEEGQGWRVKGGSYVGDQWRAFSEPAIPWTRIPLEGRNHEIALVDEAGTTVDHWYAAKGRDSNRVVTIKRAVIPELQQLVEQCLESGENRMVEFKPAVAPGHSEKLREIVEAVVAFANTDGGTILLGVSDYIQCRDIVSEGWFRKWAKEKSIDAENGA